MSDGKQAVDYLHVALAFEIAFDTEPSEDIWRIGKRRVARKGKKSSPRSG